MIFSASSTLTIKLSAIQENVKRLCEAAGQVMVMVKANGYGTDLVTLAHVLEKSSCAAKLAFLGVSHVWEGVRLREAGVLLPIFVISAPPYEAELVARHRLTVAVSSFEEVEALNQAGSYHGCRIPVHLHLDTGMSRFGTTLEKALVLHKTLSQSPYLEFEGLMTHFVAAEAVEFDAFSEQQIARLQQLLERLPGPAPRWIHAANSAGLVRFQQRLSFCNLARVGLGLFGYGPCLAGSQSALQLTTSLASITESRKGAPVGYHCSHIMQSDRARIGVIPFGYHDGFSRSLSGKGHVWIRERHAPMIGKICMDFTMIDLSEIPEAKVGDEVVLFGPHLPLEQLAHWQETDVREVLVGLSPRTRRHWTS